MTGDRTGHGNKVTPSHVYKDRQEETMRVRAVVFFFMCSTSLLAQTTTSLLTGRASSADVALIGVSVTVESVALQGTRTTLTAPDGQYTLPALPPGRYVVRFALEGMQPVVKTAELHLAETTRVDAELKPLLAEEVTVTPALATVLETPQVSANFAQSFVRELPIGRAILDIARIAPGVHDSGPNRALMINGASSYDNLYLVNGATISEPIRGMPHNLFIEDAIQETTVLTGGVSAEYGRFLGGVVSVITKSGGNQLSGTLRDTLSSDQWLSRTPFAGEPEHLDRLNHDYEGTLGGRIVRDRLWYFLAGRYQQRRDARATQLTFIPFTHGTNEARYEGKLTANLAKNHTLVGSYLNVKAKEINASLNAADVRALFNGHNPLSLAALSYTGILSSNAVIEAQFTRKNFAFANTGGSERDRIFGTTVFDILGNSSAWSPPFCAACPSEHRNNREVLLKGSVFLPSSRIGAHNIIAGISDFHERNNHSNNQSGSDFVFYGAFDVQGDRLNLIAASEESLIIWFPVLHPAGTDDYGTTSAYVNDRIDWGRHFSFNAGVRYDRSKSHDQLGVEQM
ncbi:MAG TPA: carboxypeptidase regulatory-like domain-containing protein, partial [Thermoanaerobaculia bacterium]|nr:carboxypeptidase regulatory-like domain-containing protein [Thermoanaerobaculia bacterium]